MLWQTAFCERQSSRLKRTMRTTDKQRRHKTKRLKKQPREALLQQRKSCGCLLGCEIGLRTLVTKLIPKGERLSIGSKPTLDRVVIGMIVASSFSPSTERPISGFMRFLRRTGMVENAWGSFMAVWM